MKIISWNVNGIRAVERKNALSPLLEEQSPDIFFIQETKANSDQLSPFLTSHSQYRQYYNAAEKKGYSGTSVWIHQKYEGKYKIVSEPLGVNDDEGRIMQLEIKEYVFFGVYFPNGGKSSAAWDQKIQFYEMFLNLMLKKRASGKKVIFCGDINCAHEEIDLARPETNKNSIGFLPEERAWVSRTINHGFRDIFRDIYPNVVAYSWWHLLTKARERNVGWRIDSFFVDESITSLVNDITYLNQYMGSDHCPILLDINLNI